MKFLCSTLLYTAHAQRAFGPGSDETGAERRYSQLTDMMEYFNPNFDERKYWAYGCQCLILGDRPMSDPGHGPPIDALDTVCKAYKDCLKCAREEHGEWCIGEFQRYKYGKKNKQVTCRNKPENSELDACQRKLCECDAQFARDHVGVAHVFNADYHLFWSTIPGGWEAKDNCPRGGGGPYIPKCCGTPTTAAVLFNAANKKCCDGEVQKEC
jgi:hypothetical protein